MKQRHSTSVVARAGKRRHYLGLILGSFAVVAVSLAIRYFWGTEPVSADPLAQPSGGQAAARSTGSGTHPASPAARDDASPLQVVATVNGRQITRTDLGRECLRHYGTKVLDSWINKLLIAQECRRRNIVVGGTEVDDEVKRIAQRFSLPVDQWLKMLKQERGIDPAQYANDIIWPTLALRRLAGEELSVTPEEAYKAYEMKYGPVVRARLISCTDAEKAHRIRAAAVADPNRFGLLAKEYSDDASAAMKGVIEPIRKHGSYPQIEQAAFNMTDGEISQVIPAGGQFVILKREGALPGAQGITFEQVKPRLEEVIRDNKLRHVSAEIFQDLKQKASVINYLENAAPGGRFPVMAAVINGQSITTDQLAQRCIERHGEEVLEGTINRRLIELACEKSKITVTDAELDREIVRAASVSLPPKDGQVDVEGWLELVTEKQGVSLDVYRHDTVWPTVALKKLVGDDITVTQEDMQKGIASNYGPRMRCLAIVLNNFRRAQEVWEMARANCTAEYFGELASQYSIEPGSRALRGEVPPIKKHGGQPLLEEEAFSLQAGNISGIIQVGDRFVILYCLGCTKPTEVRFEEVRDLIYEDIFEKKQRLAMAKYFSDSQDTATIDNYLTGTTRRPKPTSSLTPAAGVPSLRQVPGVE
ncbi:MAG TPA: peptidylprolyl isomerase [Thermoguttaceae bacterium]|nr:peptidylprolyl isomerase [Thermoguttaceae bacterium]